MKFYWTHVCCIENIYMPWDLHPCAFSILWVLKMCCHIHDICYLFPLNVFQNASCYPLWHIQSTKMVSCHQYVFSFVHSIQVRIAGKWLTTFVTRKTSATMNDVGMIFQTILGIFCCTSHWSQEKVVCLYCLHSYKYFYCFANLCLNKFVLFVKMFSRIACRRKAFLIYEWVCGTLNDYYVWRTSHSFHIWKY